MDKNKKYQKGETELGCLWVFIVIVIAFGWFINSISEDAEKKRIETKTKIALIKNDLKTYIVLEDLVIKNIKNNIYHMSVRIINKANYKLHEGSLKIRFKDCEQSYCITVYEYSIRLPKVPKGQARDFTDEFNISSNMKIKHTLKITHKLKVVVDDYSYNL